MMGLEPTTFCMARAREVRTRALKPHPRAGCTGCARSTRAGASPNGTAGAVPRSASRRRVGPGIEVLRPPGRAVTERQVDGAGLLEVLEVAACGAAADAC